MRPVVKITLTTCYYYYCYYDAVHAASMWSYRQAVMGVYVPVIRLSAIVCSVLTLYTTACVALTVQRSLYDTTCHFYMHVLTYSI